MFDLISDNKQRCASVTVQILSFKAKCVCRLSHNQITTLVVDGILTYLSEIPVKLKLLFCGKIRGRMTVYVFVSVHLSHHPWWIQLQSSFSVSSTDMMFPSNVSVCIRQRLIPQKYFSYCISVLKHSKYLLYSGNVWHFNLD